MTKQRNLFLILPALVTPVMGYFLAHLIFSERIIGLLRGADADFARSVLGDFTLQLCCGAPLPFVIGLAIAGLAFLAGRYMKLSTTVLLLIGAIVGFIFGFVFYFPWQIVMLIGSAF